MRAGLAIKAILTDSLTSALHGFYPQTLHVAHRWDAEEAFILSIEVGGIVVAHAVGGTGRIEVFAQHQAAGLLQAQPLLKLQGTQRRDCFEVVMEPRDAHAKLSREALDVQGLVEVLTE
jgi:hypothetical protein